MTAMTRVTAGEAPGMTEAPPPRPAASPWSDSGSGRESFAEQFERLFHEHHPRVYGYVQRLCGEHDLAADIAQETFVRFHRRGSVPESAAAWLITVATNLLRNARTRTARRLELLETARDRDVSEPAPDPVVAAEERARVRAALERLPPRDQQLLSLLAGGYRYREMAAALGIHEASVGTLLARAKRAFRAHYGADDSTP
jgi:RNA polymerase sigma-70 factor (ECF subfamily)